jgi:hypothetical protein
MLVSRRPVFLNAVDYAKNTSNNMGVVYPEMRTHKRKTVLYQ